MFNLNINFMKKQLVIFILLGIIAIPSSVKAQKLKVSLSAGLSKSILNSDVSNLVNTRYNTKTGVATRVNLEYNFFKNTKYALDGLAWMIKNEVSFKIEVVLGTIFIFISFFLDISLSKHLFLIFVIVLIFILECINSAIESIVNMVMPDFNPLAKIAKDTASSAVCLSIILAVISWGLVISEVII